MTDIQALRFDKLQKKLHSAFEESDGPTRYQFETGAQRNSATFSFHLIPPFFLRELAKVHEEGAKKYGVENWRKGLPMSDYYNHVIEHLLAYVGGEREEIHLSHAAWGCLAMLYTHVHFADNKEIQDLVDEQPIK